MKTSFSMHKEWTIKALRAGKHVLCEKSFASNALEAKEMEAAGAETGLVLMDAFHYRYHPVFIRAKEIMESGEIGKVERINAAFHVPVSDPDNIRMNYNLGGGVTMDIGCYPISFLMLLENNIDLQKKLVSIFFFIRIYYFSNNLMPYNISIVQLDKTNIFNIFKFF